MARFPSGPYPQRIERKIARAAGSLYEWRDRILLDAIDPDRVWTRWSWITRDAGVLALALAPAAASALHRALWWAVVVAVLMLVAVWGPLQARTPVPAYVGALALVLAASAGGWVPAVVVAGFAVVLAQGRWPVVAMVVGVFASVGACVSAWVAVAAGVVGAVVMVAMEVRGPGRGVAVTVLGAVPFAPLPARVLAGSVAHGPSELGWMVRVRLRAWSRSQEIERVAAVCGWTAVQVKDVAIKDAGAIGERRTALIMLGLARGWLVGHDLQLPGAQDANVDHVAIGPGGVVVADSKQFGARGVRARVWFDPDRGEVMVERASGAHPLTRELRTIGWGARAVGDALNVRVVGVMVVHNGDVPPGLRITGEDGLAVHVVAGDALEAFVSSLGDQLTVKQVKVLGKKARGTLVHADGAMLRLTRSLGRTGARPVALAAASASAAAGVSGVGDGRGTDAGQVPGAPEAVGGDGGGERWDLMLRSQAVVGEELSGVLAQVRQGVGVDVETGSGGVVSMVAMTRCCRAADGRVFVWVTDPQSWSVYQGVGEPVAVATVSVDRIVVKEGV